MQLAISPSLNSPSGRRWEGDVWFSPRWGELEGGCASMEQPPPNLPRVFRSDDWGRNSQFFLILIKVELLLTNQIMIREKKPLIF